MLHPMVFGTIAAGIMFAAALCGMRLRRSLPEQHLAADSRETVKVAVGLIATMTALILGLVTASAKSAFESVDDSLKHTTAELLALDRALARYGPETAGLRESLRQVVEQRVEALWPDDEAPSGAPDVHDVTGTEQLARRIRELSPQNDEQRWLQARALGHAESVLEARWAVFSGLGESVPLPFLTVLVIWLSITFASFGLFAPRNATVVVALLACTISVGGAIFLILELDDPLGGLIRISPEPMRYAAARIGR